MRRVIEVRTLGLAMACSSMAIAGGCTYEADPEEDTATQASSQSLAALLADQDDISDTATAMRETGLMQVFDGAAYYTLLAPTNAAFDEIAVPVDEEDMETRNAALAAVLRDHILPGTLTTEDIAQAIADSGESSVRIQTMGDHTLTFSLKGENVQVASEDGTSALLLPGEARATNGVMIPVDGVLKDL